MKKILILALLSVSSVGIMYGLGYYDKYAAQIKALQTTPGGGAAANEAQALSKVASVDTSKVNPLYADAIKKLKEESIPKIIKSAKVLAQKLTELASRTAAGGVTAFFQGAVSFATDAETRNAVISLGSVIIDTIGTIKKLANADPSSKEVLSKILRAVSEDPDVAKVINLVSKVPIVGQKLHDLLLDLITLKFL